ncbi:MAG: hypothetical protein ACOY3E_17890 [Pseudomonadota bacterium]
MTKIQIEVPDNLAAAANRAGLLKPEAIERLLRDAVRRQAANELLAIADELTATDIPPMTLEEIQAEVDAVRAERRANKR